MHFRLILFLTLIGNLALAISGFNRLKQLPEELKNKLAQTNFYGPAPIEETLNFSSVKLYRSPEGKNIAGLPGEESLFVDNQPEVPKVIRTFSVPSGFSAKVYLENLVIESSKNTLVLEKTPPAAIWSDFFSGIVFEDSHNDKFFPGQLFKTHLENGILTLVIFPIQVEKKSQEVVVLSSASLKIDFEPNAKEIFRQDGTEGIILTSEKLRNSAEKLQAYHSKKFGVRSEIVTVEALEKEPLIAENNLPAGYKNKDNDKAEIGILSTYPYELSRKIIHFLRNRIQESLRLRYLTILGDATVVPPSYYFSVPQNGRMKYGVTDLCYGAIENCLLPKIAVGRLPFSSEKEVADYLKKLDRWLYEMSHDLEHELSLYGGKGFPGNFQIGELGTLNAINSKEVDWKGVQKFYKTNFRYDKESLSNLFSGKARSVFAFHADHGMGNRLFADREWLTSDEILNLESPKDSLSPIVASISCENAAFDNVYLQPSLYHEEYGKESIGVAALKSKAGAIAYLGSGRVALGLPIFSVDEFGNLNLRANNYGLELLENFLSSYQQNKSERLGDMMLEMYSTYLKKNDELSRDPRSLWSFMNVVLLGDPALMLPQRRSTEPAYGLARSKTVFEKSPLSLIPFFYLNPKADLLLKTIASTDVSVNVLKLIPPVSLNQTIEPIVSRDFPGNFEMPLPLQDANRFHYLVRIENKRGVPQEKIIRFQTIPSP